MPALTFVLMCIGGLGILISVVTYLYGIAQEEYPYVRLVVGSFIIGQLLINAGLVYWLLA